MKRMLAGVAVIATAFALTGCGDSSDPLSSGSQSSGERPTSVAKPDKVIVGSANFPESQLLAEIYAAALESKGITVERKLNIGNREAYYPGLADGSIDLIPEYTGVLLQYVDKSATATAADEVYTALQGKLPTSLTVLDKSAAEDKDAVVVTKETADKWGLKTIEDLKAHAGEAVFGGPPEFRTRVDGLPGLKKHYELEFKEFKSLDAGGPLTVNALKTGEVQAADIFTTDPTITVNGFVVLEDPHPNFAAQNVVPLINSGKASDEVKEVLNLISQKLDTEGLTALNAKLSAPAKPDAATVAKEWLASIGV